MRCNMSLHSHLEFFPENLVSVSDEHGERFHQDISNMGARCQGKWNPEMLADYCWTLKMDIPQAKHSRQMLSHSVAAALNLYVGKEDFDSKASETAQFVYNMDKIFDSINARSLKSEKEMCAVTENNGHVELWKEKIIWIEKWHIRSSKTGRKIYAACKNGWLITLKAFIGISEVLLKKRKFIIISRFSQDSLENTFPTIRR
ncbi:hypothetical protein AVEN_171774-1 [Araneus ventricosus]|uniref:Transposable element P transposase-like GTP-binding insertion domain-containing protein n=1 Tax=Araneus ventricosus TaxID=182803 RepID=A0A4Y2TRV0_ARAVE|nr:hypothetical protein AVEN_2032-1 [Araneus ventricosus]GBO02170.1 hypothetical protein AVEN_29687-1 [Araneus ventricosus]GBO02181.1 hypothetical protein AVEN_90146-1 [Araneus ventricosus]GBO02184.1 hypothetical protein AVEN_171774-1 [Araneus ventricosus]